jgi:hypothetical protein
MASIPQSPNTQQTTAAQLQPATIHLKPTDTFYSSDPNDKTRKTEERASTLAGLLVRQEIEPNGGKWATTDTGALVLILNGTSISFADEDHSIDDLLDKIACPGTLSPVCRLVKKYLERYGKLKTKGLAKIRQAVFSAMSADYERIYVPVVDGLLLVSKDGVQTVADPLNNTDNVLVTPADGQTPFKFIDELPAEGLRLFENLAIDVQTVPTEEIRWLAAMQEMFFPFVRDEYTGERMIVIHQGDSDAGKTASEKPFVALHGFSEPIVKVTPARLYQLGALSGILFVDNQEDKNITAGVEDALIAMASGGAKETANSQYSGKVRPIISITTIESVSKPELENRRVEIRHEVKPEDERKAFSVDDHKKKVLAARDRMMSALMHVLAEFKRRSSQVENVPTGALKFSDNYRVLCRLLRAYETVAQKPTGWAEKVITGWQYYLGEKAAYASTEDLAYVIQQFVKEQIWGSDVENGASKNKDVIEVSEGILVRTVAAEFFAWAQKKGYGKQVPDRSTALGRRLSGVNMESIRVLREQNLTRDSELFPHLKHKDDQKFIGFLKLHPDRS